MVLHYMCVDLSSVRMMQCWHINSAAAAGGGRGEGDQAPVLFFIIYKN